MKDFETAFKEIADMSNSPAQGESEFRKMIKPNVDVTTNCEFWRRYVNEMVRDLQKKMIVSIVSGQPESENLVAAHFALMFQLGMATAFHMMKSSFDEQKSI